MFHIVACILNACMTFEFKGAHPRIPRAKWHELRFWYSMEDAQRDWDEEAKANDDKTVVEEVIGAVIGDPIR